MINHRLKPQAKLKSQTSRHGVKPSLQGQQGAVLVFGLVLLLAITVLGSGGIQSVMLEEKMNANQINEQLAFHGADTALTTCESFIRDSQIDDLINSDTISNLDTLGDNRTQPAQNFWATAQANQDVDLNDTNDPNALNFNPGCVTELIGEANSNLSFESQTSGAGTDATKKIYYRVTAFSQGRSANSSVILETIYAR